MPFSVVLGNILLFWQYYDIHTDHTHATDHLLRASYMGKNYDTVSYCTFIPQITHKHNIMTLLLIVIMSQIYL